MIKKIIVDIVDDHKMVLSGLKNILLSFDNIEVQHMYTGAIALLEGLKESQPDVLLLDIQMPDGNGEELISLIRKSYPLIKILVITGFDTTYYAKSMLEKGASGYLLKNTEETSLWQAIETVYEGGQYIDQAIQQKLLREVLSNQKELGQIPPLTRREKDILRLIMQEETSREIALKLNLSMRTVENQRVNLMQKLDVKNTVGLVKKTIEWKLLD
jgi:DNA-binding NarL/FixJ family response regulator